MCVSSLSLSRMFKDRDLIGKGEKGKFERVNKRESFASIFSINYNKLSIFCLMTKIPLTIFLKKAIKKKRDQLVHPISFGGG
jgi:hypothetical protein